MRRLYHTAQKQTTFTQLSLFTPVEAQPVPQQPTKICIDCHQEKSIEAFTPLKNGILGRMAYCKICRVARDKVRRVNKGKPRVCIDCGQEKPCKDFPQRSDAPQRCSVCHEAFRKEYQHQHYMANREKVLERTHAYYSSRKDQYHAYWLKRKNNPADRIRRNHRSRTYRNSPQRIEIARAYNREYLHRTRAGNPKWQAYDRARYHQPEIRQKNLEYMRERNTRPEFKEYRHQYRAAHPEQDARQAELKRIKYATDPEHVKQTKEAGKQWRKDNPLKVQEMSRRRHARMRHNIVKKVDYKAIIERDGYHCYICDRPIILGVHKLHFDHVIPLARDGAHEASNIKPTHACCNMRKNYRLPEEMTPFDRRGPDN